MRNFKGYFLVLLIIKLSLLLTACQQLTINNSLENNELDSNRIAYLNFDISHALTPEQLSVIFPKQLGGIEKTAIKLDQTTGTATAFYGNKYEISITDDLRNNFSNIHLFKKEYRKLNDNIVEGKIIKTVRDGYKTITTINPEIISISFVFKHRYIFKIAGIDRQTPYMVWRFLELNKFHELQE
jgi:hypothetical protein